MRTKFMFSWLWMIVHKRNLVNQATHSWDHVKVWSDVLSGETCCEYHVCSHVTI